MTRTQEKVRASWLPVSRLQLEEIGYFCTKEIIPHVHMNQFVQKFVKSRLCQQW